MVVEIKKGVYWVGVADWSLRSFHGHELSTHRGSSYNAYLIVDDKTVLVDTVWSPFKEQLLQNIREVLDPSKIDLVVANHSEIDHSGALDLVMEHAPRAELVVSKRGLESVKGHFHREWPFRPVATGERINIGRSDLLFVEAPMLHWPDSMFTYLTGQNILMPNDAFGQHYATAFRYNDEVDQKELFEEALKYYVNILTPYSPQVSRKIDELIAMNLPVEMIAPSHGVIWRTDPLQIVHRYKAWSAQTPEPRAAILFDTMWDATRRLAEAIGEGLADKGVDHKVLHMATIDRNDALVEVFRSRTLAIGSSTLNNGVLPTITPLLEDLRGLKFKNKVGVAFGSYGWSGDSVKVIEQHFERCKVPVVHEAITCKWQPSPEDLDRARAAGRKLANQTINAESNN